MSGEFMRLVGSAVTLEEQGEVQRAYVSYLACAEQIAKRLNELSTEREPQQIRAQKKLVDVLMMVVKRVQDKMEKEVSSLSPNAAPLSSPTLSPAPAPTQTAPFAPQSSPSTRTVSQDDERAARIRAEANQFILDAQMENRRLHSNLKANMAGMSTQVLMSRKENMMRTMYENMNIAKRRHDEYLAKHLNKKKTDEEEAIKYYQDNLIKAKQSEKPLVTSAFFEKTSSSLSSLLLSVFSSGDDGIRQLNHSLTHMPADLSKVYVLVQDVFKTDKHPLGQNLSEFTKTMNAQLDEQVMLLGKHRNLQAINEKLKEAQLQIQTYTTDVHKAFLDTYVTFCVDVMARQSLLAIEDVVMDKVYHSLLDLQRLACQENDDLINNQITYMSSFTPENCGVSAQYCLQVAPSDDPDEDAVLPYQDAINMFSGMTECSTPSDKARLVACVNKYYTQLNTPSKPQTVLGADDLLPIFTFVVIKANVPCLQSQCKFIETFINEQYVQGEEGYSLATLDTIVRHLEGEARANQENGMF